MPRNKSEEKFYGKDSNYDKHIKYQIAREDSFNQPNKNNKYINGTVEVIIPGQKKWKMNKFIYFFYYIFCFPYFKLLYNKNLFYFFLKHYFINLLYFFQT